MNNYKGKNRGGFKKGGSKSKFEGKKSFGDDKKHEASRKYGGGQGRTDRSSSPMFSATCSECGKKCEVPFRPSTDKPVYCGDCFGAKKNANEPRGSVSGGSHAGKGSYSNERSDYANLSREDSSARHDKKRGRGDDGIADLKQKIEDLDVKLSRILDLISQPTSSESEILRAAPKTATKKVSPKKAIKKPEVKKKVVKKVTKKPVAKKAVVKKATKKVVKKVSKKVAPKKVAKK